MVHLGWCLGVGLQVQMISPFVIFGKVFSFSNKMNLETVPVAVDKHEWISAPFWLQPCQKILFEKDFWSGGLGHTLRCLEVILGIIWDARDGTQGGSIQGKYPICCTIVLNSVLEFVLYRPFLLVWRNISLAFLFAFSW